MEMLGAINRYDCNTCGNWFYTINLNAGVTSFGTKCPRCGGFEAFSSFYRVHHAYGPLRVLRCWYRPTREEYDALDPSVQEHVRNGGLLCGELEAAKPLVDAVEHSWEASKWYEFSKETYES